MKTIEEIQTSIKQLTTDELKTLSTWLAEYRLSRWDEQIENDVRAGHLAGLHQELMTAYTNGNTKSL